jgi:hypothetical protein
VRKDKVITFHRVRVKDDLPEEHVAYQFRGREGLIQPPVAPYGGATDGVPIILDGDPGRTRYFKPEWLDDISQPAADVGDTVEVKAKIFRRDGERVLLSIEDVGGWIDRADLRVVERAPKLPREPSFWAIVRGVNSDGDMVGAWWRQRSNDPGGNNWFDMVHGGPHITWAEVINRVRKTGATLRIHPGPTATVLKPGKDF